MTLEELIAKWKNVYPPHAGAVRKHDFLTDVRQTTGFGFNVVAEATRIEDWDIALVIERLSGNRPPEWQLKTDALEERVKRIEQLLNL